MDSSVAAGILTALVLQFGYLIEDYNIPQPKVEWYKGASYTTFRRTGAPQLGKADCGYKRYSNGTKKPFCRIKINECLVNYPTQLFETYVHELAHAVDWLTDEKWDNHRGQWKRVMKAWGLYEATPDGKYAPPVSC